MTSFKATLAATLIGAGALMAAASDPAAAQAARYGGTCQMIYADHGEFGSLIALVGPGVLAGSYDLVVTHRGHDQEADIEQSGDFRGSEAGLTPLARVHLSHALTRLDQPAYWPRGGSAGFGVPAVSPLHAADHRPTGASQVRAVLRVYDERGAEICETREVQLLRGPR